MEGMSLARWCVPPEGWVKLNVDGNFNLLNGGGGCGTVVRGSNGVWINGFSMPSIHTSILEVELEALKVGMSLA